MRGRVRRLRGLGGGAVLVKDLQRARLGGVALDESALLESREVRVHRGGGGEADGARHLADARRVPVLLLILLDVLVDLPLALRDLARHGRSLQALTDYANNCSKSA